MSTDLLAMQTTGYGGQGTVTLNLFDAPAVTQGIQVLAQRFLTLLLRDFDEAMGLGTSLVKNLTSSRIVTDPQIRNEVALAVLRVREQFPIVGEPDELLQSVRVIAARRQGDGAFIQLELTSQSGDTVTFQLPRIL